MQGILASARRKGIKTVVGDVLPENTTMLKMAQELGFTRVHSDYDAVRISLTL
jgi:hypothetical protein